jgi:uncharacterized membrane-anchored protein
MKTKLLMLVLALQSAWILGTSLTQELALRHGQIVLLETRPVDPRDLLRGDYVTLGYKIGDVLTNLFTPALTGTLSSGQTVYVALAQRGGFHEVVRASLEPLVAGQGEIILKGRNDFRRWWSSQTNSVHVEYGLERYYVREGTGNPRGKLTVQAAVPASGNAVIKQVFVDGKPYAEAMKDNAR